MNAIRIETASPDDTEEILALIRRAFTPVARQYGESTLPPLAETAEQFRTRFSNHVVLKAIDAERIVGTVVGVMDGSTCLVGRLAVDPEMQGKGLGRTLAIAIEDRFPLADRFELFTGHASAETLGLYRSLGYREYRRERATERVELVFLEKERV